MADLPTRTAPPGIPQVISCPECGIEMQYLGLDDNNVFFKGPGREHHWYRHKGNPHHNIRLPMKFFNDEGWMATLRNECARVYETLWDCISCRGEPGKDEN